MSSSPNRAAAEERFHHVLEKASRGEIDGVSVNPECDLGKVKRILSDHLGGDAHDTANPCEPEAGKRLKRANAQQGATENDAIILLCDSSEDDESAAQNSNINRQGMQIHACRKRLTSEKESNSKTKETCTVSDSTDEDEDDMSTDGSRVFDFIDDLDMDENEESALINSLQMVETDSREESTDDDDDAELGLHVTEDAAGDELQTTLVQEVVEATSGGRKFQVGEVYTSTDSGGQDRIYGISKLLLYTRTRRVVAMCVRIISFQQTFLKEIAPIPSCLYVQLAGKQLRIHVSKLGERHREVEGIPEWTYMEESNKITPLHFCYYRNEASAIVPPTHEATLVDLFAGAGGQHQGFVNAGFRSLLAVENDALAVLTLSSNSEKQSPVLPISVRDFLTRCKRNKSFTKAFFRAHNLHASPPCQAFSTANIFGGKNDEENSALSHTFTEAVELIEPYYATYENVTGILRKKHRCHLEKIIVALMQLGYKVRCVILNASNYGDPQDRKRLFIFAATIGCRLPNLPKQSHGDHEGLMPKVTAEDAIDFLSDDSITINGQPLTNTRRQTSPRRNSAHKAGSTYKLEANAPARTILARKSPPRHYSNDRPITVREAATLQSFPLMYEFHGNLQEQYRLVGNAVPVKLATAVANAVREALSFVR